MISLLKTHQLTFFRYAPGYHDGLTWVQGAPTSLGVVEGSLQPYKQGKTGMMPPEGTRTEDSRLWYTETLLQITDEFTDTLGDYCLIGGRQFQVFTFEDWTGFNLTTDHYKYLLVAADQNTQGGN
jgi:hypothetical protein